MTETLSSKQSSLPRDIHLCRYAPSRRSFTWRQFDPKHVRVADDLPPYLILGTLDRSSFRVSDKGWFARWQGLEPDTHFEVEFQLAAGRYEVRQAWHGVDGGWSIYSARVPLDKVIGQALYSQFPAGWDEAAKQYLEGRFQVSAVEQPNEAYSFCGIPDGAFRTIAFPVAIEHLREVRAWFRRELLSADLPYPVDAEAKLFCQAVNYLEGKAPDWTTKPEGLFCNSLVQTGIAPAGLPVRELANDGSAAWTLRRAIYVVLVTLPFAGLIDFFERMATTDGPVRFQNQSLQPIELRPFVVPAPFQAAAKSLTVWDETRTTRCLWIFPGYVENANPATFRDAPEQVATVESDLLLAESIGRAAVAVIASAMEGTRP